MASVPEPQEHFIRLPSRLWKLLFSGGLGIWLFAAVITEITGDTILVPTVIIVGSFLVPVTMAAFALSRRRDGLSDDRGGRARLPRSPGRSAVVGTALLETYLAAGGEPGRSSRSGSIEELGKGAVLLLVAHQVHHREPRDGMVLGAVGRRRLRGVRERRLRAADDARQPQASRRSSTSSRSRPSARSSRRSGTSPGRR